MKELKPCPFCGGKAKMEKHAYFGFCVIGCTNFKCLTKSSVYKEKAEAIKAWNNRHERTCENEYGNATTSFKCSACSCAVESNDYYYSDVNISNGDFNYCPNCGAKVVCDE